MGVDTRNLEELEEKEMDDRDLRLIPVIRFELGGLSAGLYQVIDGSGQIIDWEVVSASTGRVISAISFEHGRYILDGCISEIRSRIGADA